MTIKNRIKSIAILLAFCIVLTGLYPYMAYANEGGAQMKVEAIGESGEQQEEAVDNGVFSTDNNTTTFGTGTIGATITHNASRYSPFIRDENANQNLELTINISTQAALTNGKIVVSPRIGEGFLGTGNPYFSYIEARFDNWGIVDGVTDNGDGTISIILTDVAALTEATVTLVFEFNGENYNGKVSPDAVMMEPIAEIYLEQVYDHSIEGGKVVSAARDGFGGEFATVNITAESSGEYVYFAGQRIGFSALIFNENAGEMLLDENYASSYSIYAPVGTQFADFEGCVVETDLGVGVQVLNGEVPGIPAGNYYIFTYALPKDSDNPSLGWGSPEGDSSYDYYTEIISSMILPVVSEGTIQNIYSALNYKLASEPSEKIVSEEYSYQFSNTSRWNFRAQGEHYTSSGQTAVSGIENGSVSNTSIRTGGGYYDRKSTGNYGNVEVNNVKFVLRQGTSPTEPSKMNFDTVTLFIGRGSENNLWPTFSVEYKILNTANANLSRVAGYYTYGIDDNATLGAAIELNLDNDVVLSNNEYIDQIIVTPMGTNGSSLGTMPPQTSFAFDYTFKAWDGQLWPDANNTVISSYHPISMGWWVEYDNVSGVGASKSGNELVALYKEKGTFPIVQSTINPLTDGGPISDEREILVKGYNLSDLGAQNNWVDPVVVISSHSGIKLVDYEVVTFEDAQGNTIGNLTVEALSESANRSFYKITFLDGYEVLPSNTGEPDFVFNLKAKLPAGLSAGEYKLDIALSSKVGTKFLVDNPEYHNNALPLATSKADFGFVPEQNYTVSNVEGYKQQGIIVTHAPNLRLTSQGRHVGDHKWQWDKYISVSDSSRVEVKISAVNYGDAVVGNLGLYTIIPFNGYTTTQGETSVGTVVFEGVEANGGRIYYYVGTGSVGLEDFSINNSNWTENPASNDMVRAIYISFESSDFLSGNQYSAVITYKVPEGSVPEYNVFSQFFVMCSDLTTNYRFVSSSQALSKDTYALKYTTASSDDDAYNMPQNLSGRFGTQNSVSVRLSNMVPQKPQHQFVGWIDRLSGDIYYPNEIISLSKTGRKEIIFQAVFEPITSSEVILRFNSNGALRGEIVPGEIRTMSGMMVQPPNISALEKDGYRTTGRFYIVSDTTGETEYWNFAQPVPNISEVEIFVEWEEKPVAETFYTISFNVNGGNSAEKPAPIRVLEGNKAGTLPNQLTKEGFVFAGWSVHSGDDNTANFTSETVVGGNLEVYAVWQKTTATVTVKTLKYNYNENWQQAVEESSKSVVVKFGEKFSVAYADIENYVFMENFSDPLSHESVTENIIINLRYQHEIYSVKAVSHLDLEVLRKTAGGNKTITVEKLAKLAELKMSSNKDKKWKLIPRNVVVDSEGLENLDLTVLSTDYNNDILISCSWPDGQVAEVVISLKVVDIKPPVVTLNVQQRVIFTGAEPLPKSESELYKSLLIKGMRIEDNYDRKVQVEFSYLEGGFSDIGWEAGEEYIVFVSAKDSSGNALPSKAIVLSCAG